jgi:hypothetical protein
MSRLTCQCNHSELKMKDPTARPGVSHLALVYSAGSATCPTVTPAQDEHDAIRRPACFDREVGYIYDEPFYIPDEGYTGDV